MSKIGINGFGRIGRLVLRAAVEKGASVSYFILYIRTIILPTVFFTILMIKFLLRILC